MVENRPLAATVLRARGADRSASRSIAFPLYVTFVASTLTARGDPAGADAAAARATSSATNYSQVLVAGLDTGARGAGRPHDAQQPGHGAGHRAWARSRSRSSSAFAIVYFRFPLRNFFFWMIFVTLMLPVEVRIIPTFKVVADLGMLELVRRPDAAADRLGHRDVPVPPVLPDRPRRARRGGAHRRRRPDALLPRRAAAAVQDQHRGAVRDPVHLRLEPVPVAAARHHRRSPCTPP